MKKSILKFIATSGYLGLIPGAPGTYGAILGCLLYAAFHLYIPIDINLLLIGLVILFSLLGTWACIEFEDEWGHDPSRVVIDETIGQWITLLFLPFNWYLILLGLIVFRFFDIAKPFGIRSIDEKMTHPFSVMLDDIIAGVYGLIIMQIIIRLVEF